MPQIALDLDDATAGQLDAICDAYNLTPSQLVRGLISRLSVRTREAASDPSWAQRGRPLPVDDALGPLGGGNG